MLGRYSIEQFSFMADAINKDTGKSINFTINGDMSSFTIRFQDNEEEEEAEATQVLLTVAVAEPFATEVAAVAAIPSPTAESLSEYSEELSADEGTDDEGTDKYGMEQEVEFLTTGLDSSVNILDMTDSSSDYSELLRRRRSRSLLPAT
ncbi:hypothetical protein SEMRO_909_G219060.1 [Seminavis robusta]|uniref:Uncharacterized protein n=1 Tax=Seminavis robusta TaxID=568900 RepID=A0A9N8EF58_9STRA|nr:hypothetical protein SEMRO_909_G219060.1 [Seminavis robusta]|eukprot:Sro909_g219060.1 n/a (149) ;mRNA; f:40915-41404